MKNKKWIISNLIFLGITVLLFVTVRLIIKIPAVNEDFFVAGICKLYNLAITEVSSAFSFSLAEILIVLAVISAVIVFISLIATLARRKGKTALKIFLSTLNTVMFIVFLYSAVTSPLYLRDSVYDALKLNIDVTEEDYYNSALYYANELNKISEFMDRDENGNVVSGYTDKELLALMESEMSNVSYESDYFYKNSAKPKIFFTSSIINYLSFSGMFVSLTGEANVTSKTPSYIFPQLIAHELAHSKGVMRENDANFLSYYCLLTSKNYFLNYCGLMRAASISLGALSGTDYYNEVYALFSETTKKEYNNAYKYYENYDSIISEIGDKINDLYLKSNGVKGGVKSYSRTQKSLCALYILKWK